MPTRPRVLREVTPVIRYTVAPTPMAGSRPLDRSGRPKGPSPAPPAVPLAWDAAYERAEATLARMQDHEKYTLMTGLGWSNYVLGKWWYVGNTAPVPRLGLPSLNMQDAAAGFRTYWSELVGSVTCWPSLLSLAATWDSGLVQTFAVALGSEFAGKGANGILGPSVNVHRVARNGRNFEYLSGEDPHLGQRLVYPFIQGVQEQGVIATVKHFAFNEQESNRGSQDSTVDERTAWELYYPPFEAAVAAGAGAVMCSYNKVNGTYACENPGILQRDLKGRMGFRGMVMSDWGAVHSPGSFQNGLDVDMPGTNGPISNLLSATSVDKLKRFSENYTSFLRQAAISVLTPIIHLRLHERPSCTPPHCEAERSSIQRSPAHSALAREAATSSVVLLKNEGGVLPLKGPVRVAVSGPAAQAPQLPGQDYYSGGGSGHVPAPTVKTPLTAIKELAAAKGATVLDAPSADADVCVVVLGTTASEGMDRRTMDLDGNADVDQATQQCRKTVVLMQTPGAVLTPWREKVAAIANIFLAGEETASAWAAVLFGDAAPEGKLPIGLPASPADQIHPGFDQTVPYAEQLLTSYRSPSLRMAFPFGHGLSYASFGYGEPAVESCTSAGCVALDVTNTHSQYAGREVVQAYIEFAPEAQEPHLVLRSFYKTKLLQPGETERVLLKFEQRDVSVYRDGRWAPQNKFRVHIGSSSADLRKVLEMQL
mmetsp:Transcript_70862/g.219858  ORF Transcript_70862/g.219858 Transcript_70862/m.219858 type:complete len:709 (-) Transcript_70862:97-2223(-)